MRGQRATGLALLLGALVTACAGPRQGGEGGPTPAPTALDEPAQERDLLGLEEHADLVLVETVPMGTDLGHAYAAETWAYWRTMFGGAPERLDLAYFYASDAGPGGASDPDRPTLLTEVLEALDQSLADGTRVRFLTDAGFVATYPALLERLEAHPDVEVRRYTMPVLDAEGRVIDSPGPGDPRPGTMHAKYLIWRGHQDAVLFGSANFDWRALEHIHELGIWLTGGDGRGMLVDAYQDVFDLDWHLAGGGSLADAPAARFGEQHTPVLSDLVPVGVSARMPSATRATPVFSPRGLLPDERLWDLPRLVEAIDGAEQRVLVQLLTYKPSSGGTTPDALDDALRRAAARGVDVRLLVADWGKRTSVLPGLVGLTSVPNAEVRFVTIPPDPGGHIPFARVIHAKYLVVDDHTAWIGTSNWSPSYFHSGRNVGLLLEGRSAPAHLSTIHDRLWTSDYAYPVEPGVEYEVPAFGERD